MFDPFDYILSVMSARGIRELKEQTHAAMHESCQLASQRFPGRAEVRDRGHLRHGSLEQALRKTAEMCGFPHQVLPTDPSGGFYTIVEVGGLTLGRGNVQSNRDCMPRKTKFRKALAARNAWLCPFQLDLFEELQEPKTGEIYAMLVVSFDQTNPSFPTWTGIGIPAPKLCSWIGLMSLDGLIRRGTSPEGPGTEWNESSVLIKDEAMPKLKSQS